MSLDRSIPPSDALKSLTVLDAALLRGIAAGERLSDGDADVLRAIAKVIEHACDVAGEPLQFTDDQVLTACKVFLAGTYGGFDHKPNDRALSAMRSALECALNG